MSKVKIELNDKGIKELLQSNEVLNELRNIAQQQGEVETEFIGFDRAHVIVKET